MPQGNFKYVLFVIILLSFLTVFAFVVYYAFEFEYLKNTPPVTPLQLQTVVGRMQLGSSILPENGYCSDEYYLVSNNKVLWIFIEGNNNAKTRTNVFDQYDGMEIKILGEYIEPDKQCDMVGNGRCDCAGSLKVSEITLN